MNGLGIRNLIQGLRESVWFIPSAAAILALGSALGVIALDHAAGEGPRAWFVFDGGTDSARQVLSTIAGSIITFTGLVFSITIVVLQLASGQFSPRVIQTFLRAQGTQIVMGIYVATFTFALVTLAVTRSADVTRDGPFVPSLGVTVSLLLAALSLGAFVFHVHHVAQSVRAVTLISRVADDTRRAVERLHPDSAGEEAAEATEPPSEEPDARVRWHGTGGTITRIDQDALLEAARDLDVVIRMEPRTGEYVRAGGVVFSVWGAERPDEERLRRCIALGRERTIDQDAAYGFRQLVDIAERALSPGVNDPSTAVQALDRIHELLGMLANRAFPSERRVDEDGRLRLILPREDWDDLVHLALAEITHYGGSSVQVVRRMRHLIEDLRASAPPDRRGVLDEHLERLDRAVEEHFADSSDRALARVPDSTGVG